MKKWLKATLIVTPLVLGTSVYAFADERNNTQGTIQIQEAQPSATVTNDTESTNLLSQIPNPFVTKDAQTDGTTGTQQTTSNTSSGTSSLIELSIDQIQKLNIKAKTDHGELKLEYHVEGNGTPRLNGEIGEYKVHLSGDKAKEVMNLILNRWGLLDLLQQIGKDPAKTIDGKIVFALKEFDLTTKSGKDIKLDTEKVKAEKEKGKAEKVEKPEKESKTEQIPASVEQKHENKAVDKDKDDDKEKGKGHEKEKKQKKNGEHDDQGEDD